MNTTFIAFVRSAAIQTPVPGSKHQNVAHPERRRCLQQFNRWIFVLRQAREEKPQRGDLRQGNYGEPGISEDLVPELQPRSMRKNAEQHKNGHQRQNEPDRPDGERFRKRKIQGPYRERRDKCRPARLRFSGCMM